MNAKQWLKANQKTVLLVEWAALAVLLTTFYVAGQTSEDPLPAADPTFWLWLAKAAGLLFIACFLSLTYIRWFESGKKDAHPRLAMFAFACMVLTFVAVGLLVLLA